MRRTCLLLATVAAPLLFTGPAAAVDVLPACCVLAPAEGHPPERHPEEEKLPPSLVPAEVARPNKRALEASAEAPIEKGAPVVNAIGISLDPSGEDRRGISEPERVQSVELPQSRVDPNGPRMPETDSPYTSPCCQAGAEGHPPDPHDTTPILVPAEVKWRDELALEATAEAPIVREAPVANAIGVPLDAERGVSEPERVRLEGASLPADKIAPGSVDFPGCCQPLSAEAPHGDPRHPEEVPPVLLAAKVKNRDKDRPLEMATVLPIPAEAPLVQAIGIPLDAKRGVSDPVHRPVTAQAHFDNGPDCCTAIRRRHGRPPVTVDGPWSWLRSMEANAEVVVPVLLLIVAIGSWLTIRRRRPRLDLEPLPVSRPMPDELPLPDAAPVPIAEPEVVLARARAEERELEPA
jgi:hypothetical protein